MNLFSATPSPTFCPTHFLRRRRQPAPGRLNSPPIAQHISNIHHSNWRRELLDEDDYLLIRENNIHIPHKLKRLKKASGDVQEERSFFRKDDEEPPEDEDIIEEDEQLEEEDAADIGEEDEMADFIVDDEEADEHGAPVRRKKSEKSSQWPGISSSELQEYHEIFGGAVDLRKLEVRNRHGDTGEGCLENQFDPSILSDKLMIEKDAQILKVDVPERMQISEETTGPPPTDEFSIKMETEWIYNQLVSGMAPLINRSGTTTEEVDVELKQHLANFLELMHVQKLDVPFIAMYRKEEILSLLKDPTDRETDIKKDPNQKRKLKWHKVLWKIQDLDRKWLLLQKRKSAFQSYYTKQFKEETKRVHEETPLRSNEQLFKSLTESLKVVDSEREVYDVNSKFNLHFPPDKVVLDEGQYKRPKRESYYRICCKAGLWEVASKVGYSSEQFGLQISLEKMRMDELEDAKETPDEMASNFTCAMFETSQAVLKGARHMAAVEISCEPSVRKHVCSIFMENAVVSTIPTPDGNTTIGCFHQFAGVKWLNNKPLNRFEDAQWLLIQKAEEEKLLEVTIKLPEVVLDKLISDSNDYYLSDGASKSAQLWNEQRKLILNDAFNNFLLPSMEKEAKSLLTSTAKTWLLSEYGRLLWDKVSVVLFKQKENDVSSAEETTPRIMACCWDPGMQATTFVMLDSSGECLKVLHAGSLNLRGESVDEQQCLRDDQQRVQQFMMDHRPHIVVLGAANLPRTQLKDDIYEIICKIVKENPGDVGHGMDNLKIVYGDESLPHMYENPLMSVDEFPSPEGIIRRAVDLGRHLQNPLAMVATLCGSGREILSWKLHPLESFLAPDEKYGMVEQVMVDVTNQVGLDINLAVRHEWLFAPLQFISGLGPRKAASLQRSLVRAGPIINKSDLEKITGFGKKVFCNVVGFLQVRHRGLRSNSQFVLFDDTRIHPESYSLARSLYFSKIKLETALEHVREKPHLLGAVDVHENAELKNILVKKKETINDIILELMESFHDPRRPFVDPSEDEEISIGIEEDLFEGRIVQAKVYNVTAERAMCTLGSKFKGMLMKKDYTDNWWNITALTDKLHINDNLTCGIKLIKKNLHLAILTCKESEMSNLFQKHRMMDQYYHEEHSTLPTAQKKACKKKEFAKYDFIKRMIVHPRFQNITADEAMKVLSDKDPGECVICPSSHGRSYLTLMLKVYDGIYAKTTIIEEHKDIIGLLQKRKTLKIREDTFEDLDELMYRYVDPMVSHLKTMLNYRKFKRGTRTEVDELLRIERVQNPKIIAYCFGISHEHPGTFILTYILSSNPHHECIGLYPEGFRLRKRIFKDIDRLVAYFQRLVFDDHNDSSQSKRSAAAMPIRSPATGGGWVGNSSNSGCRRGGQSSDRYRNSGSSIGRGKYKNGDGHPPRPHGGCGHGHGEPLMAVEQLTGGTQNAVQKSESGTSSVDPLVAHLRSMLNHTKFRKGTKSEVDKHVISEGAKHPKIMVYCFGLSHEGPGTFIVTYIRRTKRHHEYIDLYPNGFKFRKHMFKDIDSLVAYFLGHINDPYSSTPSIRSVAAMVPMKSRIIQ